ncbi:MAG TPA: arylsulfatase [Gemmataceae bacterium]|nr:arylsulfatase [Gemmataceae bacterium]
MVRGKCALFVATFFGGLIGFLAAWGLPPVFSSSHRPQPIADQSLVATSQLQQKVIAKQTAPIGPAKKPNILFILMDNLGYGEVGCYGGGLIRGAATTRIDKLARQGTKLLNFNVEPQCTPSRSAFLTGRMALRSGTQAVPLAGGRYGLTQWEITLAELLQALNYWTGLFGKWHLGNIEGRFPTDQGFDEWYGIPDTTDESQWSSQPGYDPKVGNEPFIYEGKKGEKVRQVAPFDLNARPEIDMDITDRTIDFIKRAVAAKKPFYAFASYTLVHFPTVPSKAFKGKTGNGDWADCLAQMDHNVGRLIDTVDNLGIADDTIVIFVSDNGANHTQLHRRGHAGPWSGTMFAPMEGSNRVPCIIRWPNKVPADRESNEIVHQVDTFTTLAKFAGADIPKDRPIDGLDQTDFLLGKSEKSAREGFLVYFNDKLCAARWRNFTVHYVWQVKATDPVETLSVPRVFNLLTNPGEFPDENLFNTHAWVIRATARMVADYNASLKEHPPIPPGTPDPYTPGKK